MDNYKFVVGRNGKELEGVVPGEILVDAVVLALRNLYPEAILPEEWLRAQITEHMAEDAVVPRYPIITFREEGNAKVSATIGLTRVSGTVPPLQPPPQLARPRVDRPAEWEGMVHRQMYRYVRGQIEAGIYTIGDELPTPEQLQWHFGTTSPTCGRHAYSQLIAEGLVADRGNGRYVVAAMTPPPVQTIDAAVNRLDALEAAVNETLVALLSLRGDLAGVQTPCCGQWWQVRSIGGDPAETTHAVCIHDRDTGELQWMFGSTLATRPLHHFQPLRRLTHITDWPCDNNDDREPDNARPTFPARHDRSSSPT
ncbi:GntR family transcriptional regulator [Mycobacterium sp. DSM 3803]|nr:GntR family transcriptional regulator [Mycobacterium sp. DSM 3803]